MGYVHSLGDAPIASNRRIVCRGRRIVSRAPSDLGAFPVALAAGIASKIFKGRGASLPAAMAKHKAFIDSLAASNDRPNLRVVANGGTPSKPTPPWGFTNYGSTTGAARDPNEFPQYRAYAAELLRALEAQTAPAAPAQVSPAMTALPTIAPIAPVLTQSVPATVSTPTGPIPTTASSTTIPPSLRARGTSPRLLPAAPAGPSALDTIADLVSRLAPAGSAVQQAAQAFAPAPVTVSVTSPTAPAAPAAASGAGFFEQYKTPILLGGAALAAVVILPKLLGAKRNRPRRRSRRRR